MRGKACQCQSQDDYSSLFFYTFNSELFRKCEELETIQCQKSVLNKPFLSLKKIMNCCQFVSKYWVFFSSSIIYSLFPSSSNPGAERLHKTQARGSLALLTVVPCGWHALTSLQKWGSAFIHSTLSLHPKASLLLLFPSFHPDCR